MIDPVEEKYTERFSGYISTRKALLFDLPSFLTGLVYLSVLTCLVLVFIGVAWLDLPPPRESRGEILLIFMVISALVATVIRYRISRISETLRQGETVTADVVRGLAYQFFVQIQIKFRTDTKSTEKILWLPNTRQPRKLSRSKHVTLSIGTPPEGSIIIRNLYL